MAKTAIVPAAWIAIMGWALATTDGGELFDQKPTLSGSAYSWAFLSSMTSVIGNYATVSMVLATHGVADQVCSCLSTSQISRVIRESR
jgi:cytosine/uracil/thiamine/allantoin permease